MNNKGFTLMETVIVVGITATLMIIMSTVLLNSIKLKNRTGMNEKVLQNGNWALQEIRKNLLNASGVGMVCGSPDFEVTFRDNGNQVKSISCIDNKISLHDPDGSNAVDLTQPGVDVDCPDFAYCYRPGGPGTDPVTSIDFKFTVKMGETTVDDASRYVEKTFQSKVTMRN